MAKVTKDTEGARKRSPRSQGKRKSHVGSAMSAALKKCWQDPEFRERMKLRDERRSAMMKAYPEKFFRRGVPDGMRKREADAKWSEARILADKAVNKMIEEGMIDLPPQAVIVPDSDEAKADAALREACTMALGPSEQRVKIAAIRTVLEFTKKKPAQQQDVNLNDASNWLRQVAEDDGRAE